MIDERNENDEEEPRQIEKVKEREENIRFWQRHSDGTVP